MYRVSAAATRPESVAMKAFIRGLPKAELHLHIEGTLEPEMVFALAHRHALRLPWDSEQSLRAAYRFGSLQSFLDLYYACTDVLRDRSDFRALTAAYLQCAREQGIVHVELFFDPQAHTRRGIALGQVIGGIRDALLDAERADGISHRLIPCFLRDLGAEAAHAALDELLHHRDAISAVGLDSSEIGHPPRDFAAVFGRARAAGLRAVAHAGEEGPARNVAEALDRLHVERIDHGVRCEDDPELMRRLARERVPLTICPLSNVRLGVFDRIESHNLARLLAHGLCVTVNSDDPAYFGGYLLENYLAVQQALGLSALQLAQLARHSFEASFLAPALKRGWLMAVDDYVRAANLNGC